MAGEPQAGPSWEAVAREHGPQLHRTAVMLAGDAAGADALLAAVLAGAGGPPTTADTLHADLTRAFLRTARGARRDRLVVRDRSGDVGDLFHDLPPQLRAAVVLHLGTGWPADRAARTAHVLERRLQHLVSTVPELADAVRAVADQRARPDAEVVTDLLEAVAAAHPVVPARVVPSGVVPSGGVPDSGAVHASDAPGESGAAAYLRGRRRRPLRWAAAAVLAVVVVAGLIATRGNPPEEPARSTQTTLADRGWVLGPDGEVPRAVDGLRLSYVATIDYTDPTRSFSIPGSGGQTGQARWAALWCDLPPVDDAHLQVPQLTLTLREGPVTVPCAGRTGTPALTSLTPLPLGSHPATDVGWTGDLPGRGTATLAIYGEGDSWTPGTAEGLQPVPDVPQESVAIDADDLELTWWSGPVHSELVEVGHDSVVTAWVGSAAALTITVDGINLTDDGDMQGWDEYPPSTTLWRTQDPQLREGRWFVPTPDQTRVFPLPEEVRPAPGERRAVSLTVVVGAQTDETDEDGRPLSLPRWQVQVSDGRATAADDEVRAMLPGAPDGVDPSEVPPLAHGFGLAGHWVVPADGMPHLVTGPHDVTHLVGAIPALSADRYDPYSVGLLRSRSRAVPMLPGLSVLETLTWSAGPWDGLLAADLPGLPPGRATVKVPAAPGHPDAVVLGYLPVAYEEFDFAGAPAPTDSWPAGTPSPYGPPGQGGPRLVATGERDDQGRVAFDGPSDGAEMMQVTTQGRGRLRVLVDGAPQTDLAPAHDGWWSSWTDEHVTTTVYLQGVGEGGELVLEVEGWEEDFRVDLAVW